MSGWWVVGSVSEAALFGALFLLGIAALTIVVSWQVFWPQSTVLRPGFGFWVMIITSASFIVIGLTGFVLQLSHTLASPEMRSAMASQAKREHVRRATGKAATLPNLPGLEDFTDSPGVRLTYRLPVQKGETAPLVLSALFNMAWNAMVAVLVVVTLEQWLSGNPNWFLTVLVVPFLIVSFFSVRWFFALFRRQTGIGPTAIEIDDLPLLPGKEYRLYLCQYGRSSFKNLRISLVSVEEATFGQGTDVRTESKEVSRIEAEISGAGSGKLVAQPEKPLEVDCKIFLPDDIMHSFQSEHNAVIWKIMVEGDAPKWPSFYRSFPVAVYPRSAV